MYEPASGSRPAPRALDWNLHRLRLFRAVARSLSFTAAARELAIAQPAVSHQIRCLEEELAVQLCARHGRSVTLTDVGEVLLEAVDDVIHRLDDGARAMSEVRAGLRGSVGIAAHSTSGIYVVPRALGAFHQARPAVD